LIMKRKSFLYGALFGILVGSSAALLSSPKSGREWRQTLRNQRLSTTWEKFIPLKDQMVRSITQINSYNRQQPVNRNIKEEIENIELALLQLENTLKK